MDVIAQAMNFYGDCFETRSVALSWRKMNLYFSFFHIISFDGVSAICVIWGFGFFELANNPAIQERLYEEMKNVLDTHHGEMTYEGVQEMHYLDMVSYQRSQELGKRLVNSISAIGRTQAFPPIKRGTFIRYYRAADERLLEYDIDSVIFEETSPFQQVQIVHSKSLGNMLVLDDFQNISEADLIYTETLMERGIENYKDKEIVILGGGDGALLYELLNENPKHVTMLEIDDTVMKACNEHMKSICGDVLEKYTASNYQIIVGDCMKSLNLFSSEGRKFDYVFGDLTDIPISDTPSGEMWDFVMKILQMSFKILKPTGKFMTHGNGVSCPEALKMYESQLKKLSPPVTINKTTAFVPSFLEDWVFYQISFAAKP